MQVKEKEVNQSSFVIQNKRDAPIYYGKILSIIVLLAAVIFLSYKINLHCLLMSACELNGQEVSSMKPNEFGDMLAGIASTIALIWIIVAVFLQKNELVAQRKVLEAQLEELSLARKEYRSSQEIWRIQAEAMREQAKIKAIDQVSQGKHAAFREIMNKIEIVNDLFSQIRGAKISATTRDGLKNTAYVIEIGAEGIENRVSKISHYYEQAGFNYSKFEYIVKNAIRNQRIRRDDVLKKLYNVFVIVQDIVKHINDIEDQELIEDILIVDWDGLNEILLRYITLLQLDEARA